VHTAKTPLGEVREGWNTNELGFNPGSTRRATDAEAEAFRAELTEARAFLARLDGQPVAAGMFHAPVNGVTELLGIATLEPFRGRGFAAALTAHMTHTAFAHDCDLVFLRPDDERAARVYARVGFQRATVVRAYSARDAGPDQPASMA
jgi:predicted GNAT family acetyltransferase